jgi:hypothetical protein
MRIQIGDFWIQQSQNRFRISPLIAPYSTQVLLKYSNYQPALIRVYSRNSRLLFRSAFISVNLRQRLLPFPHKGVKAAAGFKAQAAVEFHGLDIGFCHSEAQAQEVAGAQLLRA